MAQLPRAYTWLTPGPGQAERQVGVALAAGRLGPLGEVVVQGQQPYVAAPAVPQHRRAARATQACEPAHDLPA
jgi:hypothetical protein